jgi:hypothetical protein
MVRTLDMCQDKRQAKKSLRPRTPNFLNQACDAQPPTADRGCWHGGARRATHAELQLAHAVLATSAQSTQARAL